MSKLKVNTITAINGGAPSIPGFEGGGGDGSGSGADAWGRVASNGTLLDGLNCTTSKSGNTYTITFTTPMPDATYAVVASSGENGGNHGVGAYNATSTNFKVQIRNDSNSLVNKEFCFAVFATNALPPKGGTGTDAWATVQNSGTIDASFNVASVTKVGTGEYDVVFTTPMPSAQYAVTGSCTGIYSGTIFSSIDLTANGCTVRTYAPNNGGGAGAQIDASFDFTVNATNAVLPDSFSEEQIQSVVDLAQSGVTNPGASAWGDVEEDGTFVGGLNVASVVRSSQGQYVVNFTTPMPNANYSAQVTVLAPNDRNGIVISKSANSFQVTTRNTSGTASDTPFSFTVFATNALPPKGGTGTDAWATVDKTTSNGLCNVPASFNVASVTRTGQGRYDVVFTTPMPSSDYAIAGSSNSDPTVVNIRIFSYTESTKTVNGFSVRLGTQSNTDEAFSFTVFATNATLPQTVTQEQIDSAINNPGASAWGKVNNTGTLISGLNIDSVTKTGTGAYAVTFVTPMPNADYSVCATTPSNGSVNVGVDSQTAAGFTYSTRRSDDSAGSFIDFGIYLQVFATNALPPKGGTGTDSWASVQSDGTLSGSFNVASVTNSATGVFDVVFTTPMPSSNYSVVANSVNRSIGVDAGSQSTTGFTLIVQQCSTGASANVALGYTLDFTVNATNAVLPDSFSEEQIQSVVDLAQSGVTNPGASAWGDVAANGILLGGLNIGSVTRTSAGKYTVVFATPLGSSVYAPVINVSTDSNVYALPKFQTATGFDVVVRDAAGTYWDLGFAFAVFATNALPPKGGTGTDAWARCATNAEINASYNIASVTKSSTGIYDVVFTTPMPSGAYSVVTNAVNSYCTTSSYNYSSTGFTVAIRSTANSNNLFDAGFNFQVNATNATLPTTFTEAQIQSVIDAQPQGIAKAWVNFDGTGTVAIRDSFNVSSITDNGDGDYTVNYTTIMPNTNYVPVFTNIVRTNQTTGTSSPGLRSPGDNLNPIGAITVSGLRMIHRPTSVNQNSNMYGVVVFSS
jgi:hypothetical protein